MDRHLENAPDVLSTAYRRRREDNELMGRFKINPNIDAGHILVAVSLLASVFLAGVYFQNRVVVLEEWRGSHTLESVQIKNDMADIKKMQREDTAEIRKDVREILVTVNRKK